MADNFNQMNPLYGVYSEFQKLINTIVIKYSYLAEKYETFDVKKYADTYLAAKDESDTFFTYRLFTLDEFYAVGITDATLIKEYQTGDGYLNIPPQYQTTLLAQRRKSIIRDYEEKNDYYRELNGYPSTNTPVSNYHYIPKEYSDQYAIDQSIPVHRIQDYYNNITPGRGDYLISVLEGVGFINKLKEEYPTETYLKFIGSNRIDISVSRKAKNFQILYIKQGDVSNIIYDEFIKSYEQSRDYHISSLFIREYRDFIPYYDEFIAMCIMCMAIEVTLNKQFKLGIDRKYYNDFTLKMLYDVYGVPYNMAIDEYTQRAIAQSLNTLIQKKSTDEVFYDITRILGFNNLKIYQYYLTKARKFDIYGVPIVANTKKFNDITGEFEDVPDYAKMYDIYFQKVELADPDFINAYNDTTNIESYEKITGNDPFWWEDENMYNSVWKTDYNFVESKYLSVSLSYKMTEIMYENVLLLKMLVDLSDSMDNIHLTLPKIDESIPVSLFDAIILLFCLMSKKHHLAGEIISIPTQVTSVLDYLQNTDGGDEYLIDSFSFDFNLLRYSNTDGRQLIDNVISILDTDDASRLNSYITTLSNETNMTNSAKVNIINSIFTNVKNLANYLQYLMSKTTDRKTYETLKKFYQALFYSKEVKSLFTINEEQPELKRTAKNFFEYLYYRNPKLYSALFSLNLEEQYADYIHSKGLSSAEYPIEKYTHDIQYGSIDDFTYSTLKSTNASIEHTDDMVYYYIDHIISRIETYISNMKYIYMINDTTTPLEDLLLKLLNFFKSYTVDMLGLDIIYIMDFRAENTMKLLGEISSIVKDISLRENMTLSYHDVLHRIEASFDNNNDNLLLKDKVLYNTIITILQNRNGEKYNSIYLHDNISEVSSELQMTDTSADNAISFLDVVSANSKIELHEMNVNQSMFTDKVIIQK